MFNFHRNHKVLVIMSLGGFLLLSILIAIVPAYQMQNTEALPDQEPLTPLEMEGLHIYIAEGCVACHSQQVRNIEMDKMWGKRPSMPSDYYYTKKRLDVWRQSPSLLGSERTGPDLTNVGVRQPIADWHLLHLYNPRIVVSESIMPAYPWLFEIKDESSVTDDDHVLPVPEDFSKPGKKVVTTGKSEALVAYLQSLKQPAIPGEMEQPFIPAREKSPLTANERPSGDGGAKLNVPNGEQIYNATCSACHQPTGKGIIGAFPPLAGSQIVNNEDHTLLIKIILQGYDARTDYGVMPGFADQLTDEEIAAIATHERSSWGNNAPAVTPEDVAKIRHEVISNSENP